MPGPRFLCLALAAVALVLLAMPAAAQVPKTEPVEVRAVRTGATQVARDLASLEGALARGADPARCCAGQIDALAESIEALAASARPVQSRLDKSSSRSATESSRELSVALSELETGVDQLRKATDAKTAGTAVRQIGTLQARFDAILTLLPGLWEIDAYAALVAPLNRCTALVRKVCGEENECADAPTCPHAKDMLEMYNAAATEQERYDIE